MDHPATPTILLIDDDPSIRTLVCEALQEEGYRIIAVGTHAQAHAVMGAFRLGLVLTDTVIATGMADVASWDTLEALRDAAGATPVVIFSAHHPATFEDFAARGFAGVIAKPFDLDTLLDTVRAMLAAPIAAPSPSPPPRA